MENCIIPIISLTAVNTIFQTIQVHFFIHCFGHCCDSWTLDCLCTASNNCALDLMLRIVKGRNLFNQCAQSTIWDRSKIRLCYLWNSSWSIVWKIFIPLDLFISRWSFRTYCSRRYCVFPLSFSIFVIVSLFVVSIYPVYIQ